MSLLSIAPPGADEYAPFYAGYVGQVTTDPLHALLDDGAAWQGVLGTIDAAHAGHRYAEGKWSIREVVGHVIDAERIFAYRALRFARHDASPLTSFDENAYVATARSDARSLVELAEELAVVRAGSVALVRSFDEEMLGFRGTASGKPVTTRAMVYIMAGHSMHHRRVLVERYL
ncbi:MAG: DinB family protein [Gemmatimonadaceae bacterium]|jgi:uncharacterized damage-inducible protein DinB|nr:DinB family protein [Gemmatimonadaceae bacterium]